MDRRKAIVPKDRILVQLVEAKFRTDDRGRLKGDAPHLYLLRTPELVICRCHADLADEIATTVEELSVRPRGRPGEWAREYADYLGALSSQWDRLEAGRGYSQNRGFPITVGREGREHCPGLA
jgi:hypothetical protein